ncbi:MAG: DUF362 domain-containing protein [bacterium]|nr:DUF362 domain-containing protein [bacterium]
MMKPKVFLVDQQEYKMEEIRDQAKRIFAEAGLNPAGKSVFLKPSFVYPARPPLNIGVVTQPKLIGGVVRALHDLGASRIDVAEDTFIIPSEVFFGVMGMRAVLKGYAHPFYLSRAKRVSVEIKDPMVQSSFVVPRRLLEADLFISLPKIKVNIFTKVTLSVKNNLGLLRPKARLPHHHFDIHKKIADLYQVRTPDFVIADSIYAGEGQGPMSADPIHFGLMVAGANGLAVDAVSAHLMGFDPREIEHLLYLHEKGFGPLDLSEIEIQGRELLEARKKTLKRPRADFSDLPDSVRVFVGQEHACVEGCRGMVRNFLDQWSTKGKADQLAGYNFIVGKPVENLPSGLNPWKTLVIGDCAVKYEKHGIFIPGCPVPPLHLPIVMMAKGKKPPVQMRIRDFIIGSLGY